MIQVYSDNCFYLTSKSLLFIPRQDNEINIIISKDIHFIGVRLNNSFPFKGNYKVTEKEDYKSISIQKENLIGNEKVDFLFSSSHKLYKEKVVIEGYNEENKSYLMNQNKKNNRLVFELKRYLKDYTTYLKLGVSNLLVVGGYYIFSHQFDKQYDDCRKYLFRIISNAPKKKPELSFVINMLYLGIGVFAILTGFIQLGLRNLSSKDSKLWNGIKKSAIIIIGMIVFGIYIFSSKWKLLDLGVEFLMIIELYLVINLIAKIVMIIVDWIENNGRGADVAKLTLIWSIISATVLGIIKILF